MFTGIVEEVGRITHLAEGGARLVIEAPETVVGLAVGDSIAVNGTCLTAVEVTGNSCAVQMVPETIARTALGDLAVGSEVNLERAMAAAGRFDGHIVQGHVDGVGVISSLREEGNGRRLGIELTSDLLKYVVEKGSVTIQGVSLTVAAVTAGGIEIALIPHTLEVTTLGALAPGDRVNVETDILAKYVERLMEMSR